MTKVKVTVVKVHEKGRATIKVSEPIPNTPLYNEYYGSSNVNADAKPKDEFEFECKAVRTTVDHFKGADGEQRTWTNITFEL